MQTRSVTSDDTLVISANDDAANDPGDLIFKTSGVERGRIKADGTTSGVIGAGGPPSGSAGGDLTGTFPNPRIKLGSIGLALGGFDVGSDFGFTGDDATLNDTAFNNMVTAFQTSTNPTLGWVRPGVYRFATAHAALAAGVDFFRLRSLGGGPFFNQTPNGARQVVFKYMNASASTFLDFDPESGTDQSGFYLENINFINAGHANNKAISLDRVNNYRIIGNGFQGWGTGILSEANIDSAHGKLIDCLMNIPAGKVGCDILGGQVGGTVGTGFCIDGGNYTGDTGAIGVRGNGWAGELTIGGDVKFDGCTGGGLVWSGADLVVEAATRFERCSDATHAGIQITRDGAAGPNSGKRGFILSPTMAGTGSVGEKPVSVGSGCAGFIWVGGIFDNFVASPYAAVVAEFAGKFSSVYGMDEAMIGSYSGSTVGYYGSPGHNLQTGVAVSAAGIHAALVNLGLITA